MLFSLKCVRNFSIALSKILSKRGRVLSSLGLVLTASSASALQKWRLPKCRCSHLTAPDPHDSNTQPGGDSRPCGQVQGFAKDVSRVPYLDSFAKV